MMLCRLYTSRF